VVGEEDRRTNTIRKSARDSHERDIGKQAHVHNNLEVAVGKRPSMDAIKFVEGGGDLIDYRPLLKRRFAGSISPAQNTIAGAEIIN